MLRLILVVLLVAASLNAPQDTYYLSPPLPPTAFLNSYYSTQFRVTGLDNPRFTYSHLPPFLKANSNGTLTGTPTHPGSFPINVTFQAHNKTITKSVVVRVVDPTPAVSSTEELVLENSKFSIVYPNLTLTYIAGNYINIQFEGINGKKPYLWTFTQLPPGLLANINGKVNGSFIREGYYTFAVSASDNAGKTADSFVTINVQPKGTLNSTIVEVPSRNVQLQYDLAKIQAQEIQATKAVYKAINQVYKLQNQTNKKREIVANTTHKLTIATQLQKNAKEKVQQLLFIKDTAESVLVKAEQIVKTGNNIFQLAVTNLKNAQKDAPAAVDFAIQARNSFQKSQTNLTKNTKLFTSAQKQSYQAILSLKQSITHTLDTYNTHNLTFQTYHIAKKILSDQLNKKTKADLAVQSAHNQLQVATSLNDNAQSYLEKVYDIYMKITNIFNQVLKNAISIGKELEDAKQQLGASKFQLQQAKNNLFVAQAAKEQADKATAIVSLQSSALPKDPQAASPFQGCNPYSYPTMTGTAPVQQTKTLALKLQSGHVIVYGPCTKQPKKIKVGDVISYTGYLRQGKIHGLQLQIIEI